MGGIRFSNMEHRSNASLDAFVLDAPTGADLVAAVAAVAAVVVELAPVVTVARSVPFSVFKCATPLVFPPSAA